MKKISLKLKKSGIYCIVNIVNNKRYIGSSSDISLRLWTHRAELRHNKHHSLHLQRAWNKYSEQNFDYYIVEECEPELLLQREQYYIDSMKPEYNMNNVANMPPNTEESHKKQSNTRKIMFKEGLLKPSFKHCDTYVYDLDGNFIKKYSSMKDAAIGEFGKNTGAVRNACYGINNPYHRVRNRLFYLEKLDSVPKWNKDNIQKHKLRKIYIVESLDHSEKYEFNGRKEIADFFQTSYSNISQYIDKRLKFRKKYMIYSKEPCK